MKKLQKKMSMCVAFGLLALMSVGCGVTEVVVVVAGDSNVQMYATNLQVQVLDANGVIASDETLPVSEFAFPATLSITPSGDESASFRVHVRAIFADGGPDMGPQELRSTRGTSFVAGESLRLDIPLFSRCRGVVCDVGQYCAANAQCVTDEVDPNSLPAWTGSL